MKKRALVTGGAGFLGSHLCERLLSDGYDVICVDNLFTGRKENIIHLMDNPYFEFIRHDITVPLYVECDEVYNLACPASPIHYQRDPVYTAKTSIFGAVNMLGLAKRTKSKIFQASTSEVYGDPGIHPQPESYWGNVNPIGIRSCYDESKRAAESFFMDYHRKYQIPVKIMRIFNTYGPRVSMHDGRVISNFIVQALQNESITIYGDGSHTRSFCYVDDLVEAIVRLMKTDDAFTGPINAGNPYEISVLDLAQKIIALTGSESEIVFKDLPENDPVRRKPDISLARKMLDWEPLVSLDDGLAKTILYFRDHMSDKVF
ncbi:MAG: NAD-dependent dehydratase [Firmicutes bacterium HGW-Firmicutes-18]|nr:MAG: NAD-dependent dehydratase [Firmicutes bacterium HGW-Firmicutes-18]